MGNCHSLLPKPRPSNRKPRARKTQQRAPKPKPLQQQPRASSSSAPQLDGVRFPDGGGAPSGGGTVGYHVSCAGATACGSPRYIEVDAAGTFADVLTESKRVFGLAASGGAELRHGNVPLDATGVLAEAEEAVPESQLEVVAFPSAVEGSGGGTAQVAVSEDQRVRMTRRRRLRVFRMRRNMMMPVMVGMMF
eukprot:Rhum_TRINITY_DN8173_c0_g1::Rhum_TRINITY_DN8173_c0_g1_i1::g.26565::m.26565